MTELTHSILRATPLEVVAIENPSADYYVITLQYATDRHLTWKPGAAGFFTLPHQRHTGSGFRFFSIAAVPSENRIKIGTRIGAKASAYKSVLIHLQPGDRVNLRGPIGSFGFHDAESPAVMIASGVGVTPFRAMSLSLTNSDARPVRLIQSAHGFHLFANDFVKTSSRADNFTYQPVESGKEAQAQILAAINDYGAAAYYYLSGSSKVVRANGAFLRAHGIPKQQIVKDIQIGY
ncbi:ferredoxin--NADP reductase [Lacticaseibacillus brantae]|uniref:FAD-binding FR-type domain-containing protein n=1 Tax=Lacticaseibacillus brantae DSM 23927 TaxID=1423727 RepID=A0A0R2AX93_9LACO|nr:hypothetical protein [Lacticaseibacillus brantae]KRM71607.1 hypothetical protein FC34_GL001262 [Lacticaseibacillus brantae DSM 23927]